MRGKTTFIPKKTLEIRHKALMEKQGMNKDATMATNPIRSDPKMKEKSEKKKMNALTNFIRPLNSKDPQIIEENEYEYRENNADNVKYFEKVIKKMAKLQSTLDDKFKEKQITQATDNAAVNGLCQLRFILNDVSRWHKKDLPPPAYQDRHVRQLHRLVDHAKAFQDQSIWILARKIADVVDMKLEFLNMITKPGPNKDRNEEQKLIERENQELHSYQTDDLPWKRLLRPAQDFFLRPARELTPPPAEISLKECTLRTVARGISPRR